jgi:uncharacterized Zn-binding protein involved in type VI secretion
MPGLPVARIVDMCSGHIGAPPRGPVAGSMDVFINNLPALRVNDQYQTHGSPPHSGTIITGSMSVLINNLPVARAGDFISCGSVIAAGSIDTFCG